METVRMYVFPVTNPREDVAVWTPAGVMSCSRHGTSAWCYIQHDGSHIDSDRCRCLLKPNPFCPVDSHREAALARAPQHHREPLRAAL